MITVSGARETARARLTTKRAAWATAVHPEPVLTIPLKPPSEREMLADQRTAERWAQDWAAVTGAAVDWETRSWHSIGRQRIPVRLVLASPDEVASFVGGDELRQWRSLRRRVARLRTVIADDVTRSDEVAAAMRRSAEQLLRYTDDEFEDVLHGTRWLIDNPVRGLRPRQLPIRGVDTKWFSAHRGILSALHRAATGQDGLGIVDSDPLVRLRVLDDALAVGGIAELAAPASALARLRCTPRAVMVFENLESVLALPAWPGAIAIHGSGYAVDVIGSLPWVQQRPVLYWGDLDSNGFAILSRLRTHHSDVRSVLMDQDTLLGYRDMWVREPTPNRGVFAALTGTEERALKRIRDEGDVRLEQERIEWAAALEALRRAWDELG
ncbi:hypothetical protein JNB62_02330 [Microbacterium jejuense]|uniref:DUF3322 and DUF2220 domain-containing protein n=1 Tax=Microbacterium jejuense TaxID=1263637 RepID=A0ABS7HJR2_9MICO|nr:Wadjet anti-phage system protein JetD domain-containing protein [Microbacterium jejuense]MBW9092516.1 hypothetical protein [Microbacterium jejuense]